MKNDVILRQIRVVLPPTQGMTRAKARIIAALIVITGLALSALTVYIVWR